MHKIFTSTNTKTLKITHPASSDEIKWLSGGQCRTLHYACVMQAYSYDTRLRLFKDNVSCLNLTLHVFMVILRKIFTFSYMWAIKYDIRSCSDQNVVWSPN